MRSSIVSLLVSLACSVLLGCSAPSDAPGDDGDDQPPPTSDQLGVAGELVGLDGVRVLATTSAISEPVGIQIAGVPAPAIPLASETTIVGCYYQIASSRDVVTPADSPLVIGLPVPDGSDVDHLVIMMAASTGEMTDVAAPRDVWVPMLGRYDAGKRVVFSTLDELSAAGRTFVVATRPDLVSLPNPVATARASRATDAVMLSRDFFVSCVGFADHGCPGTAAVEMALELTSSRKALVELGYPEPRLETAAQEIGTDENVLVGVGYHVFLVVDSDAWCWSDSLGGEAGGVYYKVNGHLVVCLPADQTVLGNYDTVAAHELFHAEQFAFPNVRGGQAAFIEGTAAMAGFSVHQPDLHRDGDFTFHLLDEEILSPDYPDLPYQSQDLWVFVGRRAGLGLEYLLPVLAAGSLPSQIDATLPGGNLHDAYFDMATSNAMEKHELYDGVLDSTCKLETDLFKFSLVEVSPGDPFPSFTLPPLTTRAMRIAFNDFPFVHVSNSAQDSNIRFNIYKDGDCAPFPHDFQALDGLFYFVVIVNTSFDTDARFVYDVHK